MAIPLNFMQIQPVNIIQYISVFQAVFGVFLLWNHSRYRGLAYLLLFVVLSTVFNILEETANSREHYLVSPIFQLGKGPFFYLFVVYLVYSDTQGVQPHLLHGLPMLMALPLTSWPQLVIALGSISQLIYAFLSVKLILKYRKASFSNRSDAESLQLKWVLYVLGSFLILGVLDLIRLNLQPYITLSMNLAGQFLENTMVLLLYSYLIFKAVRDPLLFDGLSGFESNEDIAKRIEQASDKSLLQSIYNKLEELIRTQSLHHKPRLSLNDLAALTGLNSRDISRAINVIGGQNFCDYINHLRVSDVINSLAERPDLKINILELSFKFGFNSKSSFNAVFKREIGMTPTQYLNKTDD